MTNSFQERKNKLKNFKDDLKELNLIKDDTYFKEASIPDNVFYKCERCATSILSDELKKNLYVCPTCGYPHRVKPRKRIKMICDTFEETNQDLKFSKEEAFEGYYPKLSEYQVKTGEFDAVITGIATIDDTKFAIAVMNSFFMMGSMGEVVGEKITMLIEEAYKKKLPLIIFSASGGARMQEGIISLMQMAKTSAALSRFREKGLFISVLTHPTTGGVSASFASLGDITIAEPSALVGFAGRRVIENTIKETLPDEFQTAEFLVKKGFIDMIVERKMLKETLYRILKLHRY